MISVHIFPVFMQCPNLVFHLCSSLMLLSKMLLMETECLRSRVVQRRAKQAAIGTVHQMDSIIQKE